MTRKHYPSEMADTFTMRLPDGMRDHIKVEAAKNKRSMNAEVIFRLETAYGKQSSDGSYLGGGIEGR